MSIPSRPSFRLSKIHRPMETSSASTSRSGLCKRLPLFDLTNAPSSRKSTKPRPSLLPPSKELSPTSTPRRVRLHNSPNRDSTPSDDRHSEPIPICSDLISSQKSAVFEPASKKRAPTRKNKGKEVATVLQSSCQSEGKLIRNRERSEVEDKSTCLSLCSAPTIRQKKQRLAAAEIKMQEERELKDFVEKQRAYFAEIDAFELCEEVVLDNSSN